MAEAIESYWDGVHETALPAGPAGNGLDVEVGILHAECWAYILRRREGPGVAVTRLFPVPGYQQRLMAAIAQR